MNYAYDEMTDRALSDLFADGIPAEFLARGQSLIGPGMTDADASIALACFDQVLPLAELLDAARDVVAAGAKVPAWFPVGLVR